LKNDNLNKHEYNYHFDRDEYEKGRFTEPKSYKGGPFKHNRTLLITLLDISIIVLILLVVIPFVRKSYSVPDLNGYSLKLTNFQSNQEIFLNLSITNKNQDSNVGADLVDIEFYRGDSTDSILVNDLLPLPGESLTYRMNFPVDDSEEASAKITINGESTVLNVKLIKTQK
jgi:hypothetical protein